MRIITAAHDQLFMTWQYYVQMLNFREYGLEEDTVILVGYKEKPSDHILEFQKWTKATVVLYKDERVSKDYLPSIRPHLISKFLKDNPTEVFFYCDSDIIFLGKPNLDKWESTPYSYVAPSSKGYVYSPYVRSFNDGFCFSELCRIVGISPSLVESNDENSGGAQYIIKYTDHNFWAKVEKDCEDVHRALSPVVNADRAKGIYSFQIWALDLQVVLYNMLLVSQVRPLLDIDFCFPYETFEEANKKGINIMHNAGIHESNRNHPDGSPKYFDKGLYNDLHGHFRKPFNDDFSFVSSDILQYKYVSYFKQLQNKPNQDKMERKMLVLWNSTYGRETRKIHPLLVKASLDSIKVAADNSPIETKVVTCTWDPIPDNPFEELISPWRNLGHKNYILQMQLILEKNPGYDFAVIVEHDCLIPPNYFKEIYENWNYGKYGMTNRNYIGANRTGYLAVKERHHPFSTMSFATGYLVKLLSDKMVENDRNIAPGYPNGWCNIEPDNKNELHEYWSSMPMIHVSTAGMGEWEHMFTSHYAVCYEASSNGKIYRSDWGNYTDIIPLFKITLR